MGQNQSNRIGAQGKPKLRIDERAELLKKIELLEQKAARNEHLGARIDVLSRENTRLNETIEKRNSQIQRHKDFIVFPILTLPEVVLSNIAQKLRYKCRRNLMQSCSKFRGLLHGIKAKHLDCRIPAYVRCTIDTQDNDLLITIKVIKQRHTKASWKRDFLIPAGEAEMTENLVRAVLEIVEYTNSGKIDLYVWEMPECAASTSAIASFINLTSKNFTTTTLHSCGPPFNVNGRWGKLATFLLDSPRSLALRSDPMRREYIRKHPREVLQRVSFEQLMRDAAERRGIRVVSDLSGPETEYVLRLNVCQHNGKLLTICG